jgi:arabinogalactan oligomer/maltooligosaccharide transport system substrate-binding protein
MWVASLALVAACAREGKPRPALVLWHSFNPEETETLMSLLARAPAQVQAIVVPFPRAFNTFTDAVRTGTSCPDLFRAETSWAPALESAGLIDRRGDGRSVLAHSRDGLALLINRALTTAVPETIDELERAAAAATQDGRFGFYVRGDAYWFLPFLYGYGGDLPDLAHGAIAIDRPEVAAALARYRGLARFSPPQVVGSDYTEQERRFGAGEVAMIVNGPWSVRELLRGPAFAEHPERLVIAPLWATPTSGHGYVVPRCARDKAASWALAEYLTSPAAQAELAEKNNLVPADASVAVQNPIVAAFRTALERGRLRPAHPAAVYLFDDFTPAVQAVLRGDAEPEEALAGVARAWRRLLESHP